ncbi:MAG: hypothetical protein AAGA54_29990, partial [Myxococcota bacterium]
TGSDPGSVDETAVGREAVGDASADDADPGSSVGTEALAGVVQTGEETDPGSAPKPGSEGPQMQPIRDALSVQPGASCLEVDQLSGVISGDLRTTEVPARLSVEIVGDPEDPLSIMYTIVRDGQGVATREFPHAIADCDQLHMAIGVSITIALESTPLPPREPTPPQTRAPAVLEEPTPQAEDEAERAPDLDARRRGETSYEPSPWHGAVSVFGGVGFDAPPDIGGVGGAAVELRWRDYVDLSVGVLGARSNPQAAGQGRATYSLVGATVNGCGAFVVGSIRPRGCVGLVGGGALATGTSFEQSETSRLPWLATRFGVDLRIEIAPRLELEFGAEGLVHLLQPAFDFLDEDGTRRVGREFPWLGGWLTAGLVVNFR